MAQLTAPAADTTADRDVSGRRIPGRTSPDCDRIRIETGDLPMLSLLLAITYLALALFALTYQAPSPRRARRDDSRGGRR